MPCTCPRAGQPQGHYTRRCPNYSIPQPCPSGLPSLQCPGNGELYRTPGMVWTSQLKKLMSSWEKVIQQKMKSRRLWSSCPRSPWTKSWWRPTHHSSKNAREIRPYLSNSHPASNMQPRGMTPKLMHTEPNFKVSKTPSNPAWPGYYPPPEQQDSSPNRRAH